MIPKGGSGQDKVDEKTIKETEDILNSHAHEFQSHIAKELALRFTPKLSFFYDVAFEKVRKVDQILSEISGQTKSDNE
jgi:ribosome-binding factor A